VKYLTEILLKLKEDIRRCEENINRATDIILTLGDTSFVESGLNRFYPIFSNPDTFPSKELIVSFLHRYYNKKIPIDWPRSKIEREAMSMVDKTGGLARLNEYLSSYLLEKDKVKRLNILSMTSDEIRKEFSNEKKYPDVEFIKMALEPSFRKKLRGMTSKEGAIKRITDEVGKLRSVSGILKDQT
jgi:hypothetical protein